MALTAGCAVGPEFEPPPTPAETVETFLNAPAEPGGGASMARWWERVEDPAMEQYVAQLLRDNPTLREAGERVIQAREQTAIARGGRYPDLGLSGSVNRSFQPANAINFTLPDERVYITTYAVEFSTGWQIDLFGRVRRAVEAADAEFVATQFDRAALTHSLIAEVLTRRVSVATGARRLELARQASDNRRQLFEMIQQRYRLGTLGTALADVNLAEGNYRAGRAELENLKQTLTEEMYRLDVLLGQPPGTTQHHAQTLPLLPPPRDLAVCVPARLLDRRPDLRAARARLRAANADIGVAIADLYPSLNLSGSIGVQGLERDNLFSSDRLAGSLIGAVSNQLFAGGRLRATVRLRRAEWRAQAAAYAGTVLDAMREVETALAAEQTLARQLADLERATAQLRQAEQALAGRYREGVASLRDLLQAQEQRYQTEQNWLLAQQQAWTNRVALYLALGGDWLSDSEPGSPCDAMTSETADYG